MLRQFENPANPAAHESTTAEEIWRDTGGEVDAFVAGIGTGGTITGVGRLLKQRKGDQVRVVGVEPAGAAVLNGKPAGQHYIMGIGAGFVPPILDRGVVDEVLAVDEGEALEAARKLVRSDGVCLPASAAEPPWPACNAWPKGQRCRESASWSCSATPESATYRQSCSRRSAIDPKPDGPTRRWRARLRRCRDKHDAGDDPVCSQAPTNPLPDPSRTSATRTRPHPPTPARNTGSTLVSEKPGESDARKKQRARLCQTAFEQRYTVGEPIAFGGMGSVHNCADKKISRDVALKSLRPEHASRDDLCLRFEQEAQIQGRLEHPGIVPVYDLGLRDDGSIYFTMKRVRGVTLDHIPARNRSGRRGACQTFHT